MCLGNRGEGVQIATDQHDSRFWGFHVGNLTDWQTGSDSPDEFELVVGRPSSTDLAQVRWCEAHGFQWVNTLVRFGKDTTVQHEVIEDDAALTAGEIIWAGSLFTDSRFNRDRRFPQARVKQYFVSWLEATLQEQDTFAFTLREGNKVNAFLLARLGETSYMEFLGVHPLYQRQGMARELMYGAESFLRAKGSRRWEVGTQITNRQAIRAYEGAGFRFCEAAHQYHHWRGR